MSFGSKLLEIRLERKLSQEALAERLDLSPQTVHGWEYDKSVPNIHQLKTLCEVFKASSSYFFEEAEQNELVIAEETVAEETLLETPAQGRVEKAPHPAMLFANKWYY